MLHLRSSVSLIVAACTVLAQGVLAVDVPAGTYTDPTSDLGSGNSSVSYNLLGAVTFGWQTGTLNGNISLNSYTLTVDTGGGNVTALDGALSGTGGLIWLGGGATLDWQTTPSYLGGSAANTANGTLTLSLGTLALAKPAGVTAWAGNIVVGGGANQAILQWQNSNQVADTANLSLTGTTGAKLEFQGYSETMGTLSLQADGDIYLGSGSAIVHFANSSGVAWTSGTQLIIHDWNGSLSGGGTERLLFGSSASGLTTAQLLQVGFLNPGGLTAGLYRATILTSGEVVPSGSPVAAVNPPYDLSAAAQAARAAIYASAGRSNLVAAGTPLTNGTRMSFFGDSITWLANGAAPAPANAATANPVNDFYANDFYYNLIGQALAQNGFTNVTLFNHGINGGGVREIEDGTDHSVTPATYLQPPLATLIANDQANVVVIFIGVNDVWWRGTTTNQFLTSMSNCVYAVQQYGARPVVATIALIDERPDGSNPYDPQIEQYCAITRSVAQAAGATLVDLRSACIAYLQNTNYEIRLDGSFEVLLDDGILTYDGVHPTDAGNALFSDKIAQGIHDALAGPGTPIWIESITCPAPGTMAITFKDYGSTARTYLLQGAGAPASSAFAVVNGALFTDLGGNRYQVTTATAGPKQFYRIVAFSGTTTGGPSITSQPTSVQVQLGGTATFTVGASGSNLHYQWRLGGADLAGKTSSTLTLNSISSTDAGTYAVRVFNNAGAVMSTNATLTVAAGFPPQILSQPQDRVGTVGKSVTFSVTAQGTPSPSYQWAFDGSAISGATSTSYSQSSLALTNAGYYSVVVSSPYGAVTSRLASLSFPVSSPNLIAVDEFDGTGGTGWVDTEPSPEVNGYAQLNSSVGNYANRRFSTTPVQGNLWMALTFKMSAPATSYYLVSPANTAGSVQFFGPGFFAVPPDSGQVNGGYFTGISQTNLQTILFFFNSTSTLTTWAAWSGDGAGLGIDTNQAPLESGSFTQATEGVNSYYRSCGSSAQTLLFERVAVGRTMASVLPGALPPVITTQPTNLTVSAGGTATFIAAASGGQPLSYQWLKNGTNVSGGTAATLVLSDVGNNDEADYRVMASNSSGSVTSLVAHLTVTAGPGAAGLNLIPWPNNFSILSGSLMLSNRIVATDATLLPLAAVLSNEVFSAQGVAMATLQGTGQSGDVVLAYDNTLSGERHTITVDTQATVRGSNYAAVALGTVTVLQALQPTNGVLALPHFSIDDTPAVAIRAASIDVARRSHSFESLMQCVEMCRLYKLNYLHIHFNDDQAFTFPTTNYPALPAQSAAQGHPPYALSDLQTLESYAHQRGVFIMPELECPGHDAIMLAAMPSLFLITITNLPPGGYEPSSAINIAKPAVVTAVSNIMAEMCAVFQSTPYFHIGCDEADFTPWGYLNPDFQAAFARYGFNRSNPADNVELVFSEFITQCRQAALAHGKQVICWENGAVYPSPEVPVPLDILVMPFDSYDPDSYVQSGFKLVNAAWTPLYIVNSMVSNSGPGKPSSRYGHTLPFIYAWDLSMFAPPGCSTTPFSWNTAPASSVLGAQITTWEQDDVMEVATMRRRGAAMSERIWNPNLTTSFANFDARLASTDALLESLLSPVLLQPLGTWDPDFRSFQSTLNVQVKLAPAFAGTGWVIRYTTDGSIPTASSPICPATLTLSDFGYVCAAAFAPGGTRMGMTATDWYRKEFVLQDNAARGRPVTATGGSNPQYAVDGALSVYSPGCSGWDCGANSSSGGIALTVDLQATQWISSVGLVFDAGGVYRYKIEASTDGSTWTTLVDQTGNSTTATADGSVFSFSPVSGRYVRVTMYSRTGNTADMILDELQVFTALPTGYTSFEGGSSTLYAWPGRNIAFLTMDANLDPAVMGLIVSVFDDVYDAYKAATGRTPAPYSLYDGLSTVAEVTGTCGAGCGELGATGIELASDFFPGVYAGIAESNVFEQAVFYEFGRNFYFYDDQIRYKESGPLAAPSGQSGWIGTGYAVLMSFYTVQQTGVQATWDRAATEAMIDEYTADGTLSFTNTFLLNSVPASVGGSTTSLFASLVLRLQKWFGLQVIPGLWHEVGARPAAVTTQDAVDNFILGCCNGAQTNLSYLFTNTWRWPMSTTALAEAQTRWGTAYTNFPMLPIITQQPTNQTVATHSNATFSVTATGGLLGYQWYQNGNTLAGATAATLLLTNCVTTNEGSYTVVVTNAGGAVTSQAATLTLTAPAGQIAVDEFDGTGGSGWLDTEPSPSSGGLGLFNNSTGDYASRRFSATGMTGAVWMALSMKMNAPADSYYCVVPGNTAGSVQFFNTGFDPSLSTYGVHLSGVYTGINQTNMQTWLYLFNSTASSTSYKLWVGTGTGSTINTNNTPLKTGTVSQSSQGVNSYYRTFGSNAKTLQVERISVATNPDTALGR